MFRRWFLRAAVMGLAMVALWRGNMLMAAAPEKPRYELLLQDRPTISVNSVAVSSDGSLVASASGEGGVRVYDAKSGELVRVIADVGDRCVVFSPDSRTLTAAGFHMDKQVKLVDVQSGNILRTFSGHSQIETYAHLFSPDGKLLASACRDHEILVWEVATAKLRYQIDSAPAIALAFSPDSRTLVSGGADKTIRLWDADTGQLRRTLKGHSDSVVALAFHPDGTRIASGSCDCAYHRGRNTAYFAGRDPGCVSEWKIWDAGGGDLLQSSTSPGRLLSLAFSPAGNSLACAIGKEVRLYDINAENTHARNDGRVLTSYQFAATSVAFTPDSAAVVSSSHDQLVRRVNLQTDRVDWVAPGQFEQVNSVSLSPDGAILATGSSDYRFAVRVLGAGHKDLAPGAMRIWDARTGRLIRRLGKPEEQVMAVAISPDSKHVAGAGATSAGDGFVHVWDPGTGELVWSVRDHKTEVLSVVFAGEGYRRASASADGTVKLRDPATGSVVRTLAGHDGGATSLAFSPDGTMLVCGDGRGATRVWEVHSGRLLHTCKALSSLAWTVATDRLYTSVAFHPDNSTFFAGVATVGNTYGEPVRLWDVHTGKIKREFDGGRPIAVSPDGAILATGGKSISLWNTQTGKETQKMYGYLKKTQSITYSADGRLIFAGGSYGTTNVWEANSGRHLVTLFAFSRDHNGTMVDDWLAYHPDGYYDGSPGVERYLAWRVGAEFLRPDSPGVQLHRPDRIESALKIDSPAPAGP